MLPIIGNKPFLCRKAQPSPQLPVNHVSVAWKTQPYQNCGISPPARTLHHANFLSSHVVYQSKLNDCKVLICKTLIVLFWMQAAHCFIYNQSHRRSLHWLPSQSLLPSWSQWQLFRIDGINGLLQTKEAERHFNGYAQQESYYNFKCPRFLSKAACRILNLNTKCHVISDAPLFSIGFRCVTPDPKLYNLSSVDIA